MNGEHSSMMIDEAYLYKYMPAAERLLLSELPPDEELNHKFSRHFERKMKALIKYEERTPGERKFYRGMKIAFAAIAIMILVAFGSAMSVKAGHYRIIEFFIEVFTDKTSYSVEDERPEGVEVIPLEPDYVPEGYEVIDRQNNVAEYFVIYENIQGEKLYYNQATASMVGRFLDTEVSITDEIKVAGTVVHIIEEDTVRTVYWSDEKYVYRIVGPGHLELEKLIKMAQRVIK